MLDELIKRYGPGAPVVIYLYEDHDGTALRWIVEIDGTVPVDVDVRVREDGEWTTAFLARDGDEVEFQRWHTTRQAPVRLVRTLGTLHRAKRGR